MHSLCELVEQRVYELACGYEECNDSARLCQVPVQRLLQGRDPIDGTSPAPQPTLSRFENGIDGRTLLGTGNAIADRVIERHRIRPRGRVRRIMIDIDPTDDPSYGEQQLTLFNSH